MTSAKEPKATEQELLALLDRKHARAGNGGSGEWAFLTHVRNDGGFSATRTFDGLAVALWPSRGYSIHVYEVKVSRSDWMRELKDPAKSEAAWEVGDYFTIVATAGVVQADELPPGWGLIEAYGGKVTDEGLTGRKLRTVKAAAYHGPPAREAKNRTIPRGLLVAMLRRAGAVPDAQTPSQRALDDARRAGAEEATTRIQAIADRATQREHEIAVALRRFTNASGITILPDHFRSVEAIDADARKIRELFADADRAQATTITRLTRLRDELTRATADLDASLKALTS